MDRILLLFIDGIGLAPAGPDNPFHTVATPTLDRLLGGSLVWETVGDPGVRQNEPVPLVLMPLDAQLGVAGLPQSATGQTALFTGINAPARLGHHVSAFPGPRLKALINQHGILRRARKAGCDVTFANAYSPGYFERVENQRRGRHSATTLTALAAGLTLRSVDELHSGEAVTWDVTRERFNRGVAEPPPTVTAAEAGRHLARIAGQHHLTLWETFLTDLAGHRRFEIDPREAVERLDGLLAGVLEHRPPEVTVVLTSDHGNLEDMSHTVHTENPVPLLAVGPAASWLAGLEKLTQVTPSLLSILGVDSTIPEEPSEGGE